MTRIYIDTEFNGFNGDLISMALVAPDASFYEVLECKNPVPWVKENVMTVLEQPSISYEMFQKKLQKFLSRYDDITIIADWPDDIKYFCESLITAPGKCVSMKQAKIDFSIIWSVPYISSIPHNALQDAIGIKNYIESG